MKHFRRMEAEIFLSMTPKNGSFMAAAAGEREREPEKERESRRKRERKREREKDHQMFQINIQWR